MEDIDLFKYAKKEGEKEDHYPEVNPVEMDVNKYDEFINKRKKELENNIQNTETLVSPDG